MEKGRRARGCLYIVATPIGNLSDFSPRAVEILRQVDLVASEDTRVTQKLLSIYDVRVPLISFFEHNEEKRIPELITKLEAGMDVAIVSDAGTPLISDPGYRLVKEAANRGIRVIPIPGPSAVMAALSVSGLPTDRFTFVGFLPRKASKRRRELKKLVELPHTLVLFESPHRLLKTLSDMEEVMGERSIVLCREMTKKFEEILRGTPRSLSSDLEGRRIRGELTLVVSGREKKESDPDPDEETADLKTA